jgi:hypothetical protein
MAGPDTPQTFGVLAMKLMDMLYTSRPLAKRRTVTEPERDRMASWMAAPGHDGARLRNGRASGEKDNVTAAIRRGFQRAALAGEIRRPDTCCDGRSTCPAPTQTMS